MSEQQFVFVLSESVAEKIARGEPLMEAERLLFEFMLTYQKVGHKLNWIEWSELEDPDDPCWGLNLPLAFRGEPYQTPLLVMLKSGRVIGTVYHVESDRTVWIEDADWSDVKATARVPESLDGPRVFLAPPKVGQERRLRAWIASLRSRAVSTKTAADANG